jgi:hypothetical protein
LILFINFDWVLFFNAAADDDDDDVFVADDFNDLFLGF